MDVGFFFLIRHAFVLCCTLNYQLLKWRGAPRRWWYQYGEDLATVTYPYITSNPRHLATCDINIFAPRRGLV